MKYLNKILEIQNLNWKNFNPYDIAYISIVTGTEFAESLLFANEIYPENELLKKLMSEELWTTNLKLKHYKKSGHHVHFLYDFFITNALFHKISPKVSFAGKKYLKYMRTLNPTQRLDTVFSREQELPGIFSKILKSQDWKKHNLDFYAHYLSEHIYWDGAPGGHSDIVNGLIAYPEILDDFYEQRLLLYKSLIK